MQNLTFLFFSLHFEQLFTFFDEEKEVFSNFITFFFFSFSSWKNPVQPDKIRPEFSVRSSQIGSSLIQKFGSGSSLMAL